MSLLTDSTQTPFLQSTNINPVAAAASLVPELRLRHEQTERLGRLPERTISDLESARLFELLVPNIYGGQQTSLNTYMDTVVQLGRGDGSTAWTVGLLSSALWQVTISFPKQVIDEIYASGEKVRIAGSLSPRSVKTRHVEGGVVIEDGVWGFNSGVHHAHFSNLAIPVLDREGRPIDRATVLIPTSQVVVLDDWDTIGLRGTGSASVTVKDVFVPNERIALLSAALREDYGATHLRHEPLYRHPAIPMLATNLVFPALGMARAALELFLEKAPSRGIAFTIYQQQDEATVTHLQAAEASSKIDAAELMLKRSIYELETSAAEENPMSLEQRARIWRNAGFASRLIWEAVDLLAGASGGSFAQVRNPMNRLWRDVRIAGMHGGISTSTTMELFGRVLFSKPSISPLLQQTQQ
jgi:alkylation response protein AidB-like acyl-CoA dehydrogenase